MMEAAAVAANGAIGLVGVTVLTSHDPASYARAVGPGGGRPGGRGRAPERGGVRAGLAGRRLLAAGGRPGAPASRRGGLDRRARHPGARPTPAATSARVATAAEAVAAGATHLVVGRPILQAADPAAAFRGLLEEAQCVGS